MDEHFEENAESICRSLFPQNASEALKKGKYYAISLTELICHVGIEAGLAESKAYTIRENFLKSIRSAESPEALWLSIREMLTRFCDEVYCSKTRDLSPAVNQCCHHIHKNIRNSLSLSELGTVCHLSPHYVSDLFRKELGVGALQYAHHIKLQYAKYLLEFSELGIAELAAALSYPSHSNFSQRFKKTYGITPNEYRLICR